MARLLLLISCLLVLCSCKATGPKFDGLSTPPDNQAIVYILRPDAYTASLREIKVTINDEKLIKLQNGGYTFIKLEPATYKFTQSVDYIFGDPKVLSEKRTFELKVEAGNTYFIGFHADSAVGIPWKDNIGDSNLVFIPLTFKYGFGVMDKVTAMVQLQNCNFQDQK